VQCVCEKIAVRWFQVKCVAAVTLYRHHVDNALQDVVYGGSDVKQLLIYDRPVPLNRDKHRDLRILMAAGDMRFAAAINSAPVAAIEFGRAATEYPIVFAGSAVDSVVPAVLMGLRDSENLMVGADGLWADQAYIPAFLRRYPFVLADKPGSEDDFTVCLDEGCPGLGTEAGEPLFTDSGEDGPLLSNALQFLGDYQQQMKRTQEFVARLQALDLLHSKVIRVQPVAAPEFTLQGLFVVDEAKLRALKARVVHKLMGDGDLGLIYAHLLSLSNVVRLTHRMDARRAAVN